MRGKVRHILNAVQNVGITPAYAGKSSRSPRPVRGRKDHPRVCGEKSASAVPSCDILRITPAYAGKSFDDAYIDFYYFGSPPHMRGKVPFSIRQCFGAGITPAYAGKRLFMSMG